MRAAASRSTVALGLLLPLGLGASTTACSGGSGSGGGGAPPPLATARIGPAGGTIRAGAVTLEVPPGALTRETEITIGLASDVDTTLLPGGIDARAAGPPYQFGPSGLQFAIPARASLPASASLDLVVALRDDLTGRVELLRPSAANGGTLTVELPHFSTTQPLASQEDPPQATSVVPATGAYLGSETVTIRGGPFRGGFPPLEVYFGTQLAPFASVVSSSVVAATADHPAYATEVVCQTPHALAAGPVDVTVRNSDGPSVTLANAFTYGARPPGPSASMQVSVPSGVIVGAPFALQVTFFDTAGYVNTSESGTVTVELAGSPPPGATLSGTLTAQAVGGVASFSDLIVNAAGSGYSLRVNSPGLPSIGVYPWFTATGTAQRLAFLVQPSDIFSAGAMSPAVQVVVLDAAGNTLPTADEVTLTLNGTGGGRLLGSNPRTADQGVARFFDIGVDAPGTYTLDASAFGLPVATSVAFTVTEAIGPVWRDVSRAMVMPRGVAAAAAGPDGLIYVAGTADVGGTNAVEVFDPRSQNWGSIPGFPTPRRQFAMASGADGRIYVLGGLNPSGTALDVVEAYSPAGGQWTTVAVMPTPRAGFPAVTGSDGLLYALLGLSTAAPDGVTAAVQAFAPGGAGWGARSSDLQGRRYAWAAAALGADGHLYMGGGSRRSTSAGDQVASPDVWRYDSGADAWALRGSLLTPRWGAGAVTGSDGRIWFVGGAAGSDPFSNLARVEAWDPASGMSQPVPGLSLARRTLALVRGVDGRIYAFGGTSADGSALSLAEVYGPYFFLSRSSGGPGTPVGVTGWNFAPSATVRLYWGTTQGTLLAVATSDALGNLSPSGSVFTVPVAASGVHMVTAVDDVSGFPVNVLFTVP